MATFEILYDPAANSNYPTPDNVMRCLVRIRFSNPYVVGGEPMLATDCSASADANSSIVGVVFGSPISADGTIHPVWDGTNVEAWNAAVAVPVEYTAIDLSADAKRITAEVLVSL